MKRLIDADAIDKRYVPIAPLVAWGTVHYEWVAFIDDINELPTIDAVPVKRGHWIETEENHGFDNEVRNKALSCSVCQVAFRISDYAQIEDFRYCPNCGARMDKDE